MHIKLWKWEGGAALGKAIVESLVVVVEHAPEIAAFDPGTHREHDGAVAEFAQTDSGGAVNRRAQLAEARLLTAFACGNIGADGIAA